VCTQLLQKRIYLLELHTGFINYLGDNGSHVQLGDRAFRQYSQAGCSCRDNLMLSGLDQAKCMSIAKHDAVAMLHGSWCHAISQWLAIDKNSRNTRPASIQNLHIYTSIVGILTDLAHLWRDTKPAKHDIACLLITSDSLYHGPDQVTTATLQGRVIAQLREERQCLASLRLWR
jgi:hypothetical protein